MEFCDIKPTTGFAGCGLFMSRLAYNIVFVLLFVFGIEKQVAQKHKLFNKVRNDAMVLKCLAVDSNLDIAGSYAQAWAEHGVDMERVGTMTDAIQKLMLNDYIFVGINGDCTDFMPLLKIMRSVTKTPIFIATSRFETETEIAALNNGADLYARWHGDIESNIASVLAHIERLSKSCRCHLNAPHKVLVYMDLIVAPSQYAVYRQDTPIELTRQEFELLHYLVLNKGIVLTYEQIHSVIWKDMFDASSSELIKHTVKRIRKKISDEDNENCYIENVRGIGYRLNHYTL